MLNSMRSTELTVKINLNDRNGGTSDSGVNFGNQSESLASIKELDVVPEKLDSLAEHQQNNTNDCPLDSNLENVKNRNVSFF